MVADVTYRSIDPIGLRLFGIGGPEVEQIDFCYWRHGMTFNSVLIILKKRHYETEVASLLGR